MLGHTQCGAVAGATKTYKAGESKAPGSALEGLLQGLAGVAQQASEDLGPGAEEAKLIAHAVKVNVFHSMNFLLKFSEPLRDLVRKGNLQIQGGIYHLETGRVEFLGRSPQQAELLSSKRSLPPSIQCGTVRTAQSKPVMPQDALAMLKDGNERFTVGAPTAGKVHQTMRADLNNMGQAPHTALVGCADSRVPLETVFDALPGDLFVLRNAGNTCTHAEGSVLGSLEFCTGALNTRLIFVLGHTACGAIKGATKAFLESKKSGETKKDGCNSRTAHGKALENVKACCCVGVSSLWSLCCSLQDGHALDALLQGLSSVAESAASELGSKALKLLFMLLASPDASLTQVAQATEDSIAQHAVKLNVFHTINFMLQRPAQLSCCIRCTNVSG